MKISTRSQYGLRAMAYLAKLKEPCSLRIIAQKEDISFDYLEKIMTNLRKEGFVKTKKGAKGGYFLARNPKKISVGEIVKILEGDIFLVPCLEGRKRKYFCRQEKRCQTKKVWKKLKESLKLTLNSMTLADLIR